MIEGMDVLSLIETSHAAAIENGATPATEEPAVSLVIASCGEWVDGMPIQGHWAADGVFKPTK